MSCHSLNCLFFFTKFKLVLILSGLFLPQAQLIIFMHIFDQEYAVYFVESIIWIGIEKCIVYEQYSWYVRISDISIQIVYEGYSSDNFCDFLLPTWPIVEFEKVLVFIKISEFKLI